MTLVAIVKKYPLHFAALAVCAYPMAKVTMQTEPPAAPSATTNTSSATGTPKK